MEPAIVTIPADSCCANCGKEVVLNEAERATGHFVCPGCGIPSLATLGTSARCGGCTRMLSLDPAERALGRFRCPFCKRTTALPGKEAASGVLDALDLVVPSLHDPGRDIRLGAAYFGVGVVVTVGSIFLGGGTMLLAWGPIGYGAFRLIRGLTAKREVR